LDLFRDIDECRVQDHLDAIHYNEIGVSRIAQAVVVMLIGIIHTRFGD
jgi:hypothetical protein